MLYLFLAILLFTTLSLLSAAASRRTNSNLVTLIVNTFSVLMPLIILAPAFIKKSLTIDKPALIMTIIAGLCVGLFAMTVNKSFTLNKVGIVIPVVFGGTIMLTAVLSYFIFKETLKGFELAGLLLILAGLGFIIYARSVA